MSILELHSSRYGFNPGSAWLIDNSASSATAALCAVTTTVAAASGCVTAMFTDTIIEKHFTGDTAYDLTVAMNGALAGLVGISAGCSVVAPWAAVTIGMVAGWVYYGFSKFLIKMRIDDAVDAIPVHSANGMWGVIAVGLFAEPDAMAAAGYSAAHVGWFFNGSDATLLLVQVIAAVWILGWVGTLMAPFFLMLHAAGMFRVDPLEEEVGLDISLHRGPDYDLPRKEAEELKMLEAVRSSRSRLNIDPWHEKIGVILYS